MAVVQKLTKEQLYRQAKRLDINGRSKMNKGPAEGCARTERPLTEPVKCGDARRTRGVACPRGSCDGLGVTFSSHADTRGVSTRRVA